MNKKKIIPVCILATIFSLVLLSAVPVSATNYDEDGMEVLTYSSFEGVSMSPGGEGIWQGDVSSNWFSLEYIMFDSIEDFDELSMVKWNPPNDLDFVHDNGDLNGASALVTLKKGATEYGSGIIYVSFSTKEVYLSLSEFDRKGLTGEQAIFLDYNTVSLDGLTLPGTCVDCILGFNQNDPDYYCSGGHCECRVYFGYDNDGVHDGTEYNKFYMDGWYSWSARTVWYNRLEWETLPYNASRIDLFRYNGGKYYVSSFNVSTDLEGVLFEDTDQDNNVTVLPLTRPIYITVCDDATEETCYERVLYPSSVAQDSLYGYIRNAFIGNLLTGVNVTLEGITDTSYNEYFNTSSMGYYYFGNVGEGQYYLNATRDGYENYTLLFCFEDTQRLDLDLIPVPAVHSGTVSFSGLVTDYTIKESVSGAMVQVYNDTYSTYQYTNEHGYFVFYDLGNSTYSVKVTHDDYNTYYASESFPTIDEAYFSVYELLAYEDEIGEDEDEEDEEGHWYDGRFEYWGITEDNFGAFKGLLLIIGCALALGKASKFNGMAVIAGAVIGLCIAVFMGLLPLWLAVIIGICAAVLGIRSMSG